MKKKDEEISKETQAKKNTEISLQEKEDEIAKLFQDYKDVERNETENRHQLQSMA